MYYKVDDAISAVANVDDYSGSARLLAATTLRNVLGTRNLGDVLSERESIASEMQVNIYLVVSWDWDRLAEPANIVVKDLIAASAITG